MLLDKKFILASNSASRKMLLRNAGLSFFTEKPLCDEDYIKDQLLKKNINIKKLKPAFFKIIFLEALLLARINFLSKNICITAIVINIINYF